MNTKLLLFSTSLFITASLPSVAWGQRQQASYEIAGRDTTCQLFLYSPGPTKGLHVAYFTDHDQWQDMGQLCGSDYGAWGSEKKMYSPYVIQAQDGTWRLLFSVNNYAPCFAAAYSEDLVTWRPQDYPRVKEKGVLEPIMFQMDPDNIDIYFRAKDGSRHYVQASNDFRHFTESADASTIEDAAWMRDTATIAGTTFQGNAFDVPKLQLDYLFQYFDAMANDARMSAETMKDDAKRFASLTSPLTTTLTIDLSKQKAISDRLMGVFFEDISYAADGGLYAELVQNRDFEYTSDDHRGWDATTAWKSNHPIRVSTAEPLSKNNPHYVLLTKQDTLYNTGWGTLMAEPLQQFDFSVFVRSQNGRKNQLLVSLVDDKGEMLAKEKIKVEGEDWRRYALPLIIDKKAAKSQVRLMLTPLKEDSIAVDMVSLFPHDTFKGHGLRKDLAEAIAALRPRFVRFPGGCMSHGQGLDNIYHWNESVGPWQDRKPAKNIWNYHQTRGLGFYEYFQFCEDIGAEPLPVLAAGVPCQNSAADKDGYGGQQGGIPMADMPAYCQEILNMIEWANGDPATSKWAKMRADAGHPAPFHLKYIGIGNEDLVSTTFEERYEMICKAIKQKYPDITVCGTVGPFHNPSADYIEGWRFAKAHHDLIDMVDEHYYESPGWFLHHQDYYDDYDRKGPKVYLGEWASRDRRVENALVEAIHLCNVERNADIVSMASYAPLLCNEVHQNWNPDMIYFNSDSITALTPSYYTQQLWGQSAGDRYLASQFSLPENIRYRVASSVVRDEKTGTTWVKLVNALPQSLTVDVKGLTIPSGAEAVGFCGQPNDKSVKVETTRVSGSTLTLKPYSVTVITLPRQ